MDDSRYDEFYQIWFTVNEVIQAGKHGSDLSWTSLVPRFGCPLRTAEATAGRVGVDGGQHAPKSLAAE